MVGLEIPDFSQYGPLGAFIVFAFLVGFFLLKERDSARKDRETDHQVYRETAERMAKAHEDGFQRLSKTHEEGFQRMSKAHEDSTRAITERIDRAEMAGKGLVENMRQACPAARRDRA